MDYKRVLDEFSKASMFDLFRLFVAIRKELDSPDRIDRLKNSIHVGMEVSYFEDRENRLINAKVTEKKIKKVVVYVPENDDEIIMPYYMLNLGDADVTISASKADNLTANNVIVGDWVGFHHKGEDIIGVIRKINRATVSLVTTSKKRWRVYYKYLFRVHDAELGRAPLTIEASCVEE
jgi:exonuclease III